ncbi:MAG: zinc ribbon domain-containing protein [Thermoplasmata archaeon]|nr:zinc ribbon domain-containing protein [Thermoplasmata archaeon]
MAQWARKLTVGIAAILLVVASALGAVSALSAPMADRTTATSSNSGPTQPVSPLNAPLTVSLTISPSQVQKGQSISVSTTPSGGTSPYTYSYSGLPSGCQGQNSQSFNCNPSSTGNFQAQVNVMDSKGNNTASNFASLTVTSSSSGSGSGSGNNSSNPFNSLLSGLGGFVQLLLIFGIIGFATWILLIVGVWIIAIVLVRRLPKRGADTPATATVKCAACSAAIPAGSKFCPACGTSTTPKST